MPVFNSNLHKQPIFLVKSFCLQCHVVRMIFYKLKRSWSSVSMAGCSWFRAWSLKQSLYFLPGHASRMGETPAKNLRATSLFSFVSLPKTLLCYNFSVTLQSNKVAVVAPSYYANHNYGPVDFSIHCLSNLAPCQGSTAILYSQKSDILSSPLWLGWCYLSGVSAFASKGITLRKKHLWK